MIAGIAVGFGALIVVAIIIALLAQRAIDAEQRCADARVNDATKAGQIAVLSADLQTARRDAADEKARADALDLVLDDVAADGDANGARARVLSKWARQAHAAGTDPDAADGGGSGPMPVEPAAPGSLMGDGLISPDAV